MEGKRSRRSSWSNPHQSTDLATRPNDSKEDAMSTLPAHTDVLIVGAGPTGPEAVTSLAWDFFRRNRSEQPIAVTIVR
jgi:NADH dehydrogenase FAD-containing subunit